MRLENLARVVLVSEMISAPILYLILALMKPFSTACLNRKLAGRFSRGS